MSSGTSNPSARGKLGRPPAVQLTEAKLGTICAQIAKGAPQWVAAASVGVPSRTFKKWLQQGRMDDAAEPYATIALRVDLALEKYHASRAILHAKLAKDDPRALEWELERRFRDQWAAPDRSGVTVNVGVLVESPEWREMRDALIEELSAFPDALAAVQRRLSGADVIDGEIADTREIGP